MKIGKIHCAVFGMLINSSFRYTEIHRSGYTSSLNDADVPPIFGFFSDTHGSISWAAGAH